MGKGLDAPKTLAPVADALVRDGYTWVSRYYFNHSGYKDVLTHAEALTLSKAGLYIVSVYENGYPTTDDYFTKSQGHNDAIDALRCAHNAQQTLGSPIYFAVDGDITVNAADDYFEEINAVMKSMGNQYRIGVYGSGAVLQHLKAKGLVLYEWLSQSHGWRGYEAATATAQIIQGSSGRYHGRDVDFDRSNGSAGGWKATA